MFDHIGIRVSDIGRATAFYDSALAPLGLVRSAGGGYGPQGQPAFWLAVTATGGGAHIAFAATSRAAVDAFHQAGLAAGGRDNGKPGPRPDYGPGYYAAFLIDPDGNNIEAGVYADA
jgi:catechol 2,3-dioxygenase-like lactoylglutathione lyase family enzyme